MGRSGEKLVGIDQGKGRFRYDFRKQEGQGKVLVRKGVLSMLQAMGKELVERKKGNQSLGEEGDQSKRKKITFSEQLLCIIRSRLDVVNKYQFSEGKICIFFILIFSVLHIESHLVNVC